jgi:hypothetical protein
MVLMMVFRPGGLIQSVREVYVYRPEDGERPPGEPSPAPFFMATSSTLEKGGEDDG